MQGHSACQSSQENLRRCVPSAFRWGELNGVVCILHMSSGKSSKYLLVNTIMSTFEVILHDTDYDSVVSYHCLQSHVVKFDIFTFNHQCLSPRKRHSTAGARQLAGHTRSGFTGGAGVLPPTRTRWCSQTTTIGQFQTLLTCCIPRATSVVLMVINGHK